MDNNLDKTISEMGRLFSEILREAKSVSEKAHSCMSKVEKFETLWEQFTEDTGDLVAKDSTFKRHFAELESAVESVTALLTSVDEQRQGLSRADSNYDRTIREMAISLKKKAS